MKVSGMTRLNTAEYKFILIVVFLNFNLLLLLLTLEENAAVVFDSRTCDILIRLIV